MDIPAVPAKVEPDALTAVLDGRWAAAARRRARADARASEFARPRGPRRRGAPRPGARPAARTRRDRPARRRASTARTAARATSAARRRRSRCSAYGDLSLLVKAGVQWGLFGGAVAAPGTERHHDAYLRRIIDRRAARLLRDDRDRPRLRRAAPAHHGDVRPGHRRVRRPHARPRRPQGLHRQRRPRRPGCRGLRAAVTGGESRGVHAFVVPIRDDSGDAAAGRDDRGLRSQGRSQRRRQRPAVLRPASASRATTCSTATATSPRTAPTRARSRTDRAGSSRCSARSSAAGSAWPAAPAAREARADDRHPLRRVRRQFAAPGRRARSRMLDYLGHQRKLLPALAKTYALHFAQHELVARRCTTCIAGARRARGGPSSANWRRGRPASRRSTPGTRPRTIQDCREACGGAGYLAENRLAGLKADTDVFTTFEGDNTVLLQLVAKELLTDYRDTSADLDVRLAPRASSPSSCRELSWNARPPAVRGAPDATPTDDESALRPRLAAAPLRGPRGARARRRRQPPAQSRPTTRSASSTPRRTTCSRAARAHVDTLCCRHSLARSTLARTGGRGLLSRVCDLYALSAIEEDRAWFLEHGRLTTSRVQGRDRRGERAVRFSCVPHARDPRRRLRHPVTVPGGAHAALVTPLGPRTPPDRPLARLGRLPLPLRLATSSRRGVRNPHPPEVLALTATRGTTHTALLTAATARLAHDAPLRPPASHHARHDRSGGAPAVAVATRYRPPRDRIAGTCRQRGCDRQGHLRL